MKKFARELINIAFIVDDSAFIVTQSVSDASGGLVKRRVVH
jgi:hypothetical protein